MNSLCNLKLIHVLKNIHDTNNETSHLEHDLINFFSKVKCISCFEICLCRCLNERNQFIVSKIN